ncbi:primosomal protein N' [Leptotrichia shahii]|uniref:Replication restart protein PriA n=2 Tax=Leptotrichia shahii TaxID=157691 RepID=A0A510JSS4_9FUSO|nr:primosomal protein N' [Leptotrichia shahii]
MYYYEIYIENNRGIYTYKSKEKYEIGQWCIVNFINRYKMGLILAITEESKIQIDISKIKKIKEAAPVLSIPDNLMQLIKWIRNYYISDYYSVIKAVYPGALKLNYSKKAIYQKDFLENEYLIGEDNSENSLDEIKKFNDYMKKRKEVTIATLKKNFSSKIVEKAINEKVISIEKKVILNSKISKGEKKKSEIAEKEIILNDEQQKAVDTIKNSENQIFLLKGITGSGKTEIYINLIKESLKQGFGSIFLVPEISLTVQMIQRLEEEFHNEVAILHSKLTDKEKREEWTFIRNGEKKIVIGARSAIFAPVQNLKYIIVDEEHENTYKQENNPRYHVKNVAIKRAFLQNDNLEEDETVKSKKIKVILGSATPSFETYYQAQQGDIELVELTKRYKNAKLPKFEVIDLNETAENFSEKLLDKISQTLKKNEQAILILNRKAFSNLLKCKDCGNIPTCPNCSISLNYYKYDNQLKCHYCGYETQFNSTCDECGSHKMRQIGAGTEKIEEELAGLFPSARIVRVDSESIKTKQNYEKVYNDFKNHKYDIMLGTQIIAKGLDFSNVTLVGIINADIILNFPDFRASEKTFQLLTQASGRAGRGEKDGEVIIQTFNGENDVIKKTIESDYEGYYKNEMIIRKMLNYPPFGRIVILVISATEENLAKEKAQTLRKEIVKNIDTVVKLTTNNFISDAFKSPIYKINGRYRYQIFFKFERENILKIKKIIKKCAGKFQKTEKKLRITIDVDPINMM